MMIFYIFQLIGMRYEKHPTIITTNKAFSKWGEVFGDIVLANTVLERDCIIQKYLILSDLYTE